MQKTLYEDFKYCIQDTGNLYVGAKYTLDEIAGNEEILFKFRKVCAESLKNGACGDDTLESVLYYLTPDDFRVQVLKQMRSKVKICTIREKSSFGKTRKEYVSSYMSIPELVKMTVSEKEAVGMMIQELRVSKLALMTV